jgi:hypothetical protein
VKRDAVSYHNLRSDKARVGKNGLQVYTGEHEAPCAMGDSNAPLAVGSTDCCERDQCDLYDRSCGDIVGDLVRLWQQRERFGRASDGSGSQHSGQRRLQWRAFGNAGRRRRWCVALG